VRNTFCNPCSLGQQERKRLRCKIACRLAYRVDTSTLHVGATFEKKEQTHEAIRVRNIFKRYPKTPNSLRCRRSPLFV
jgi:hypothetical protein